MYNQDKAIGSVWGCYCSGDFLGRHGTVAAAKRAPEHYLPEVGDIILYNENTSQIESGGGSFGKTPRGIWKQLITSTDLVGVILLLKKQKMYLQNWKM